MKHMFKTALNKNIIPHTWKLANIIHIPNPNKDTDKGTSYMPISLLSVIGKTLEKSILPYITENILNTPMQHGYKTQHSTVTALHTLNDNRSKRVQPNGSPCANNHCSTRYEQSFRQNKHTYTNQKAATDKHSQTQSLSSSQTTSRDAKPTQHIETTHPDNVNLQFGLFHKAGVPFHPHYLTFYTSDLPPP